jgi:hypothetical protein
MGRSFIACDREQSFSMPADAREWLAESHLAWFVLVAVEEVELKGTTTRSGRIARSSCSLQSLASRPRHRPSARSVDTTASAA